MSLLYECINGVIQGGILEGAEGIREGDDIANLCVDKLRGMIVMEGDPNRKKIRSPQEEKKKKRDKVFSNDKTVKYVALLAFNRIVVSHPDLVARQQDVIMGCLDDSDISIRLQALELASGMVTSDTLQTVVNRLITQLQTAPTASEDHNMDTPLLSGVTPSADFEGNDPEERLQSTGRPQPTTTELPNHYRNEALQRILEICSKDNYAYILDFEWYVDVLVQLLKLVPPSSSVQESGAQRDVVDPKSNVATHIGTEIRNVAVRVKTIRPEATRAAESLILLDHRVTLFPTSSTAGLGILEPIAWVVGEYADCLTFPDQTLSSLVHSSNLSLPARVLSSYLQAIPKLFVALTSRYFNDWDSRRESEVSLLLARITEFLEQLSSHPDLDVQERAIEFLELLRLTVEAINSGDAKSGEVPLLLSSAIPSLFTGLDLNPVAAGAQRKVPLPENLDLDTPLNIRLPHILNESDHGWLDPPEKDGFRRFYYVADVAPNGKAGQKEVAAANITQPSSYQNMGDDVADSADIAAKRRAERRERNKDDPFYIGKDEGSSGTSTPLHQVLRSANGEELDIDSIPIIDLPIDDNQKVSSGAANTSVPKPKSRPKPRRKVEILAEENIEVDDSSAAAGDTSNKTSNDKAVKPKKSVLQVDSSGLTNLSLEEGGESRVLTVDDLARKEAEEAEMANAVQEIERLRMEMRRASERVQATEGEPEEGTVVKRKKKKKPATTSTERLTKRKSKRADDTSAPAPAPAPEGSGTGGADAEAAPVKRKKKKKASSKKETTTNEAS